MNWRNALPYAVGLALLTVVAKCQHDASQRKLGAAIERNAILAESLSVVEQRGRKIDTVFRRDTLRLVRRIETTITLLDTLLHSDTVTLTKRESVLVFVADSLVTACRETLTSCSQRIGNLQQQLSLTTEQRDLWRHRAQPSLWDQLKQIPGRALTTSAIATAGFFACKIGG